jgi:hypothetical protein
LKTSLQANLYCLSKKELYAKGWRGQFPPYEFEKLNTKIDKTPVKTSSYLQMVGTKLKHISPIDKMTK